MKYEVLVIRTSYANTTIEVEAKNKHEAAEKALNKAGDYEFSEHTANYEVDIVSKIKE